ncbi:Serine/threonine-protein kinase RIO1 [Perkinsus chesapeaki]|uniref:Serine/threonine-protein kinase RIO1 n=1 Tax=Perkinsus chesapeaki TaxID=330153 RepID=A0A7J6LX47_PERCH|nr:Serine/threonine-protein kinase RIO1 [Perkinsus chesapeaki]
MSSDDEEEDDELLFLDTYIPSTLNQFSDLMEMEVELSKHAKGEKSVYNRLLATTSSTRYINNEDNNGQQEQQEQQQQQQDDDDDTVVVGGGGGVVLIDDGHIPDGMSKGEWKRLVKEKRRAKLENKCPKHIKKRYRSKAANR